jgi:hypothetical protein
MFSLGKWGRTDTGSEEHPASRWQKVIRPPTEEMEPESERPAFIRRYLDLADLLIKRVQNRVERSRLKTRSSRRKAA